MKYLIVLTLMCLTGCNKIPPPMTNEEIVAQHKFCESQGMKAADYFDAGLLSTDGRIRVVQCESKEQP